MTSHCCVLSEALITVADADGEWSALTLPGLLQRLGQGMATEFVYLQPHQSHAWHAFLTQLGALAVARGGLAAIEGAEDAWRDSLLSLTAGERAPWCLVVDDLAQPALLQSPVPEGALDRFKRSSRFPDEIDVLVTTRNHDVKDGRIGHARPEHWIYALVSLQTMSGFTGRGNYGIARMNSGYGTRVCVALTEAQSEAHRFQRDVQTWLDERARLVDAGFGYAPEHGHALLWLEPWDGMESLGLHECDPFFIEVSRRVRLTTEGGVIFARWAPTKAARLAASELKGNTGDIWVPIKRGEEPSALTLSDRGFSYRVTHELLGGGDFQKSAAQSMSEDAVHDHWLIAQGLVRGQGTTSGYRERWLRVPGHVAPLLRASDEQVGAMAARRVDVVDEVGQSLLRPALCTLVQGAPDDLDFRDERIAPWAKRLDDRIDRIFFDALWEDVEKDDQTADRAWKRRVIEEASRILQEAIREAPIPNARFYRAIAASEGRFWGIARKRLPEAFDDEGEHPPENIAQAQSEE